MKTETIGAGLLTISLISLITLSFFFTNQLEEIKKLNEQIENQRVELFNEKVYGGRYEMGIEIFKERNPKAARQLEEIISQETE